jgi:hypothetical protein
MRATRTRVGMQVAHEVGHSPYSSTSLALLTADELAIARSILYASLFDYPLTLAQLRQTLIESTQTPTEILDRYAGSEALQAVIDCRDGFFFPRGRADLVEERRRREARSREFLADHRVLLGIVCALPYVKMVALSGSIAHANLQGGGDLDLFIVTRGPRVWSVTVTIVLLAKLMRRRRTLCANFVLADSRLALEQQDLFVASQIIHLKPLAGRPVYREFLAANPFVGRFYPNFHEAAAGGVPFLQPRVLFERVKTVFEALLSPAAAVFERLCRAAYRTYLVRRSASWRSREQVRLEPDCLKLHTKSHRQSILERFDQVVRKTVGTGGIDQ